MTQDFVQGRSFATWWTRVPGFDPLKASPQTTGLHAAAPGSALE